MAQNTLIIPLLGQRGAPAKFKGGHAHILNFIDDFEQLVVQFKLSLLEAKRQILRYCSTSVQDTIRGLPTYEAITTEVPAPDDRAPRAHVSGYPPIQDAQWTAFTTEFKRIYGASLLEHRYKERDLVNLTNESRKVRMESLSDFHSYERHFRKIGGWLVRKRKIDDLRFRTLFLARCR
jgi:hypothetical protein